MARRPTDAYLKSGFLPPLENSEGDVIFKSTARQHLVGHELEISKQENRPTTSPKRRTHFDEAISNMEFSRDRPMSKPSRDRPYSSPKKTDIRINVILDKPLNQTARQYDDADILFHKKYQKIKKLAKSSSDHIKHVLEKIETAYLFEEPRPKTSKISRPSSSHGEITFERANRSLKNDIAFFKTHQTRPLKHPEWNEQFVHGKALSPPIPAPVAPIHQVHDNFVKSMSKYSAYTVDSPKDSTRGSRSILRSPNESAQLSPSMMSTTDSHINLNFSGEDFTHPKEVRERSRSPGLRDDVDLHLPDEMARTTENAVLENSQSEFYDSLSSEDNLSMSMKANTVWTKLVARVHALGAEIQYSDLFGMSILREPPAILSSILGFCAILMGLKPDWSTIRSTLLKEARIFHSFLKEVSGLFCLA